MTLKKGTVIRRTGRNKYLSGYCLNGLCEGTRPKNHNDKPLKTCPWWDKCPCECHKILDDMFAMQDEVVRHEMPNPEYRPDLGDFVMPTPEEMLAARRDKERSEGKADYSSAAPEEILKGSVFNSTESGYRARGQLEYQVFVACSTIAFPNSATKLIQFTPKIIGEYIAKHEGIEPPSSGAIQAVWDRWVKMGFAQYEKHPVRFTGFLPESDKRPTIEDLDLARAKYHAQTKREKNDQKRQTIRGRREG